jgi:hypothetical protein
MGTGAHLPFKHLTEVYSKNKKYFIVLLGKKGDPAFQEKLKNVYKAFLRTLLRPQLQSLAADDFILECTLEYSISAFLGVMTYCFTREENPDIEKMVQLQGSLMNDGVMKNLSETFQLNRDGIRKRNINKSLAPQHLIMGSKAPITKSRRLF